MCINAAIIYCTTPNKIEIETAHTTLANHIQIFSCRQDLLANLDSVIHVTGQGLQENNLDRDDTRCTTMGY